MPVLEQELAYGEGAAQQSRRLSRDAGRCRRAAAGHHRDSRVVGPERQHQGDDAAPRRRGLRRAGRRSLRRRDGRDAGGGAGADERRCWPSPTRRATTCSQAYDYLEKYAFAPRIASIGWCLGGGWSLQTALLYPDALDAMVMYYGQVLTDRDRLAPLNCRCSAFSAARTRAFPCATSGFRATLMRPRQERRGA